ncbi:TetR/AcrR family transcriptional regulator [Paenibacillus sp. TC-CSREp1]|uniref:TetR/AcrR family transcriptional regulator n=1 Tax=Paenibacillus sp. TC-CSREp1 TaxID=3410089 RepID=UPI003CEB97CB
MGLKVKHMRNTRTKDLIFEAFVELVNEKDFEKITIQNVTVQARINRATFYSHFQDKYEFLEKSTMDSAIELIHGQTGGICVFTEEKIRKLVHVVFKYHQQVKTNCHRSYKSITPLLRKQMIQALQSYFNSCLHHMCVDDFTFYSQMYSTMIYDAVNLRLTEQTSLSEAEIADKMVHLIGSSRPFIVDSQTPLIGQEH